MAQIQKGTTYVTGGSITALNINAHVDSAVLLPGAIVDQSAKAVPVGADSVLLNSVADAALRKTTLAEIAANIVPANATLAADAVKLQTARTIQLTGDVTGSASFNGSANAVIAATLAVPITPTTVSDQANTSTGYFDIPSGTTAQRPGSPNSGNIRYNSTAGVLEYFSGVSWNAVGIGGLLEVLIVGGGGGGAGGNTGMGGGGAGGFVAFQIAATTSSVTVGGGGGGGAQGGSSSAFGITALGGGAASSNTNGNGGASGGGSSSAGANGGSGTSGQGQHGAFLTLAGGGGGAGSPGVGVVGGAGRTWVDRREYCAGGGGGQGNMSPLGLYGNGGRSNAGGGAGVVIIRYYGPATRTGGTITSEDGYTYHTFTANGTFTSP